jgi:small subunit ribosomal protein S14
MAKVSSVEKNKNRTRKVEAKKATRQALKAIVMDRSASFEARIAAVHKLAEMPRNSAAIRIRNRCGVTGRPRGFYRKFGMSRISLRELGSQGLIPGLIKASW